MCSKKLIHWPHLESLQKYTDISDADHCIIEHKFIQQQLRTYRVKWKACKKRNIALCQKFLSKKAGMVAIKLGTTREKAIRAILKSEESRRTF